MRDGLKSHLDQKGIPNAIYYPVPLYKQKAFAPFSGGIKSLPVTETLCNEVISLPMHTELTPEIQDVIINEVLTFLK